MVEHSTALLPFKPKKTWVLCKKPATLQGILSLMEAPASSEAGLYLISKGWKKGAGRTTSQGRGGHRPDQGRVAAGGRGQCHTARTQPEAEQPILWGL